jgi:hypothetical protein
LQLDLTLETTSDRKTPKYGADPGLSTHRKSELIFALKKQPEFTGFFSSRMVTRKIRLEEDLADQLCDPCEVRLARTLLLLADFGHGEESATVTPRIDQHTLAAMVGTTQPGSAFYCTDLRSTVWSNALIGCVSIAHASKISGQVLVKIL